MSFLSNAFTSVVGAVGGLLASAGSVIATIAGSAVGRSISGIVAAIGLSFLADILLRQKETSSTSVAQDVAFTVLVRAGTDPHRIFYGERLASGVITYITTTEPDNANLHIVMSISGTQVESLGGSAAQLEDLQIFIDDEVIGTVDSGGTVTTGIFKGLLRVRRHFGEHEQAADSALVSDSSEWTTNHRLQGRAYLYLRLIADRTAYPNGIPNIKVLVRGRKLWDPRIATIAVTSSSVASNTLLTTAVHGLSIGDAVFLLGHSGAILDGDSLKLFSGELQVLTVPSTTTFTVPFNITTAGTGGTIVKMLYTDNAALVLGDYLVKKHGLKADPNLEIDFADLIVAANVCDEEVSLPTAIPVLDFTVDNLSDNRLVQTVESGLAPDRLHNLDGIEFTTTGTLPTGLATNTRYFALVLSSTKFHICSSLINARSGTVINITGNGSGTHTLNRKSQPRYTINAIISRNELSIDVIPKMAKAMFGPIPPYSQGEYHIFAGKYIGPATITVTDDYLRGPIQVTPRPGVRNRFNGVRGTFIDRDTSYNAIEFIPVQDFTAEANDGQELFRDVEFPYVTDNLRAQRLARLVLKRGRSARIAELKMNMMAQRMTPHDVVNLTIDLMGWMNKGFEVLTRTLAPNGLGIDLTVKEIFSTDLDVAADTDITIPGLPVPIPLPGVAIDAPTNLVLTSGTSALLSPTDGTIISRIKLVWIDTSDHTVLGYDVQFKQSIDSDFLDAPFVRQGIQIAYIEGVQDGINYDVRIRALTRQAKESTYLTVSGHTVIGKTEAPSDVTGFKVQQNGLFVTFIWDQVSDIDLAGYTIKYAPKISFLWASATPTTEVTKGTTITDSIISPSTEEYTFGIKAVDTSGNESSTEATVDVTISNQNIVIIDKDEHTAWQGATITGFIRHDVSGSIVPDDQDLATGNNFNVFDTFIVNPVAISVYEAAELDLGFDSVVRAFATVVSALGPGETIGNSNPQLTIDYKKEADSYDGFENWTIGDIEARQVKMKLTLTPDNGKVFISQFTPTLDVEQRIESAEDVAVSIVGTNIIFTKAFHLKPNVQVTADGITALFAIRSSVTTTGFTVNVFNSSGFNVGGVIDWTATGA